MNYLIFGLWLLSVPSAYAQTVVAAVADTSCTDESCAVNVADCVNLTFKVDRAFSPLLRLDISCSDAGGACHHCAGCLYVFADGKPTGLRCHTPANCAGSDVNCAAMCFDQAGVTLRPGVTYTLYVCKMGCDGQDCESSRCRSDCVVTGQLLEP